jgi:hypothetical protein
MHESTIDPDPIARRERDLGRGSALVIFGAVMVLLKWVLPVVAPLAIAAYGFYRLYHKEIGEGLVALSLAVLFYFLRQPLGWLIWLVGALMVGFGLFYLIRGVRAASIAE